MVVKVLEVYEGGLFRTDCGLFTRLSSEDGKSMALLNHENGEILKVNDTLHGEAGEIAGFEVPDAFVRVIEAMGNGQYRTDCGVYTHLKDSDGGFGVLLGEESGEILRVKDMDKDDQGNILVFEV